MRFINEKNEKTAVMLEGLIVRESKALDGFKFKFCDYKKDNVIPAVDDSWEDIPENMLINTKDTHMWVIGSFKTPKAVENCYWAMNFEQKNPASNVQTLLYLNGKMIQGLDKNHCRTFLEPETEYNAAFYCYFDSVKPYSATVPELQLICDKTEKLYFDYFVPYDVSTYIDNTSYDYQLIMKHLELCANLIDFQHPYSKEYYESVEAADKFLTEEFYGKVCGNNEATVNCLGHSHMDIAWLWEIKQTKEKAQRSFSTVTYLMERYPEYIFMMTSPQLYTFLKEEAPEQFELVKQKVKEGKWEVDGAMWLEADGNLPSGESFIRQFVHGKRFFKEEFGVDSKTLWIPDVFGYSATLPQIMKKCGVDRFVTGKISWNDTNRMPNDTFYWKGIDGSEVFVNFLTTKDFENPDKSREFVMINGDMSAREVKSSWDIYRNKEMNNEALHTFGFGDGGGGPTYQMLEKQKRLQYGIPGMPKTTMSKLDDFLDKVQANFDENCKKLKRTPKWSGEIYLEYHRGTYTSMSKTKRQNRECEFALMDAELFSSIGYALLNKAYPDTDKMWKLMLLNDFHDIIPGSSIKEVYDTSDEHYAMVRSGCNDIKASFFDTLKKSVKSDGGYLVFNPHSYETSDVVEVDGSYGFASEIPSKGYVVLDDLDFENHAIIDGRSISNTFFEIVLAEDGSIETVFDKISGRELFDGNANVFEAYEDEPRFYDAWEITYYYRQKAKRINNVKEIKPYKCGAKAGLTVTWEFCDSTITQNIIVYDKIRKIDFETTVDWKEKHLILKTLFPMNVFSNKVTSEIQFGNVERPTHKNTSWDEAKYETCMHKWVDMSDNGFGVSLLNNCKYGFSANENEIGLTILKCSTSPNVDADREVHHLTYSIYPHDDLAVYGGTVQQGYNLNQKMTAEKIEKNDGFMPASFSFVECDCENIIIETIKKCEEGDGLIVRLYDAYNICSTPEIKFGFDVKKASVCDMLENEIQPVDVSDNAVMIDVKNFEIVTLKIEF